MTEPGGNRRIDRIRDASYLSGLPDLSLEELKSRRDECFAEGEYLSLLRRLVQGRAEILRARLEARGSDDDRASLLGRLGEILTGDEPSRPPRGEAVHVGLPEEEMLLARRRVERLVADAGLSDPTALDDEQLSAAIGLLLEEEREVSATRAEVYRALDTLQDELKRRYKDDPTLAIR